VLDSVRPGFLCCVRATSTAPLYTLSLHDALPIYCVEAHLAARVRERFDDRIVTIGRVANLTRRLGNRGPCQYRNLCVRGCPYGGYFSSNSATIPAAFATGNLTLRPFSIVTEVIYDEQRNR